MNLPAVSSATSNIGMQLDAFEKNASLTPSNPQDAAVDAIFTMGHWDNQYKDLIVNILPKLSSWPAWRGLVIVEGASAQRYDADCSRPVPNGDIKRNDVIVGHSSDQYITGVHSDRDLFFPKHGDGFFRAVLTGLHALGPNDPSEELISDLRAELANYVRENWHACHSFLVQNGESLAGDSMFEFLDAEENVPPSAPVASAKIQAMEMLQHASGIGKPSLINMLMNQIETMLAPALDAIRGKAFTPKDMDEPAMILRLVNRTMVDAPPIEKAMWIQRGLQELFSTDAKSPVSKAEAILKHRDLPALKPVVHELMIFMENTAQELEGDALIRFADLLGVNIAQDGQDRGIAQDFIREAGASGPANPFRIRFENLREEFGMTF